MEEIITIDGKKYKLTYNKPLTADQRSNAIAEIQKQSSCVECGSETTSSDDVKSMAPTCPGPKQSGDTVTLNCAPDGGVGPYTVTYYKKVGAAAEMMLGTSHTVPEGGPDPTPYTDTITDSDVSGATGDPAATPPLASATIRYRVSIEDSCPTGVQTCTELCDVGITCVAIACNFIAA